MRKVFTKENSSCQAFINVRLNGDLKCSGTLKIRGFGTFAIYKSGEGGLYISYGYTLTFSSRRHLHVIDTCYV
jgi:hypothetical protein